MRNRDWSDGGSGGLFDQQIRECLDGPPHALGRECVPIRDCPNICDTTGGGAALETARR